MKKLIEDKKTFKHDDRSFIFFAFARFEISFSSALSVIYPFFFPFFFSFFPYNTPPFLFSCFTLLYIKSGGMLFNCVFSKLALCFLTRTLVQRKSAELQILCVYLWGVAWIVVNRVANSRNEYRYPFRISNFIPY
jgi:hypothetical protein